MSLINTNKKKVLLIGFWIIFFLNLIPVEATNISWQKAVDENSNQIVFVLRLQTDNNERENTWSGQINFDPQKLKLRSISDAYSLISLWLERPTEIQAGQINFSGITPGGFRGSGEVLRLFFSQTGDNFLDDGNYPRLTKFEAFGGDGSGKNTRVTISPKFDLIDAGLIFYDFSLDQTAPELYWQFTREKMISAGWQLFVNASDKQSGVKYSAFATTSHYFMKKDKVDILNSKLTWQILDGPKIFLDHDLKHIFFLKTVDNAGNVKIIKLYPIQTYSFMFLCIIIIGLIVLLFL